MTIVLVEGESDRAAVEVLAARLGVTGVEVRAVGGSKGARRAVDALPTERVIGLVDANERADFEAVLDAVFVCAPDLEGEFVRALGAARVVALLEEQGEGASFRRLQRQPAQRGRTLEEQLGQFFAGRSGNKLRYARLMADAVELTRMPPPLRALLDAC